MTSARRETPGMHDNHRIRFVSSATTHVGMVRKVNEDAVLELPDHGMWAVADGMGGHAAGDFASQTIMQTLTRIPPPRAIGTYARAVQAALGHVNTLLRAEAARRGKDTIGATVVVLLAAGDGLACVWAGDSRLYRLRRHRLELLTRDHSYVQELFEAGAITAEESLNHPMGNVVTRAVGAHETIELEARPVLVEGGDMLLLCSDGLNKTVRDEEIAQILGSGEPRDAARQLVHRALLRGAPDNVSVVVIRAESEAETTTRPTFWQ